jgi:Protein of unknown function (DUF1573)
MRSSQFDWFLAASVLLFCGASAQAQLRTETPVVELGAIRGGQKLTHCFELINSGDQVLEILDLRPGCGCLAPRIKQRSLAPSEKTTLVLELRTLGQAEGPHTWDIDVKYRSGAETKTLPLALRGAVHNEITVQPAILGLHVVKSVQQEITVTDARPAPLHVLAAEARAPGVQVTRIDRTGKTTKILVSADATQLAPGRHDGVISIVTDDPDYSQLLVPVVLTKAAPAAVRAIPEQVDLHLSAGANSTSAIVRLRPANDQPVRIAKIEPSDPALVCTWAAGPGNDATLKIQVQAGCLPEAASSHIIVHFGGPVGEPMTIPVTLGRP